MDTEEIGEIVSTALILGLVAFLAAPSFGYETLQRRVGVAVAFTVIVALPIAAYMVLVSDGYSHFFGPWGPEDLVFLVAIAPVLTGTVWLADSYGLTGVAYWLVVAVGLLAALAFGIVVRAATVGEWPPGAEYRGATDGDGGPPGGR